MTAPEKAKAAERAMKAETAETTTGRKRRKEPLPPQETDRPDRARKVKEDSKAKADPKATDRRGRETGNKVTDNRVMPPEGINPETADVVRGNAETEVPDPTTHLNNKERNRPEMKNPLKNKAFLRKSWILLLVASLCMACDEQVVYHSFQSLPTEGWQRTDTLFFNVEVPDSATLYNVSVEVRNRNNYPYQNLPLLIHYDSPEAQNIRRDTLKLKLANSAGIWIGDGWGGLYQSAFPAGLIRIGKAGEYRFKITHLLPDEVLPGINDVGIKLKAIR